MADCVGREGEASTEVLGGGRAAFAAEALRLLQANIQTFKIAFMDQL